jgi:hypothetical protein
VTALEAPAVMMAAMDVTALEVPAVMMAAMDVTAFEDTAHPSGASAIGAERER